MRADAFPLIVLPLPTAVDVNTTQAQERELLGGFIHLLRLLEEIFNIIINVEAF